MASAALCVIFFAHIFMCVNYIMRSVRRYMSGIAAGNSDVVHAGDLHTEFDAIIHHDASDDELDAMLGIGKKKTPER